MVAKSQLIVTVGPASLRPEVLSKLEARRVDYVRLNMSHTPIEQLEPSVAVLRRYDIEVCLDTEGSQLRTGDLGREPLLLSEGHRVRLFGGEQLVEGADLVIRPAEVVRELRVGDLISIDFNSAMLRVMDTLAQQEGGYVDCTVVIGGLVGSNKAVSLEGRHLELPALSAKDLAAIRFAAENDIRYFTLSFVDSPDEVEAFRELHPRSKVISKIETLSGVDNLDEILALSDGLLIDRGDLSREVAMERLPLVQKLVIHKARAADKDVFVASNVLDTMTESLRPSRGELNDIISTLLDGATGLVLTKETAVGKYPVETVNMMNSLQEQAESLLASFGAGESIGLEALSVRFDRMSEVARAATGRLPDPHGGELVDMLLDHPPSDEICAALPRILVSDEVLMDAEQIAVGGFSPLRGFMNEDEFDSVVNTLRLPDGVIWPVPVALQLGDSEAARLAVGDEVLLCSMDGVEHSILLVESVFRPHKEEVAQKVFGTTSLDHPGVRSFLQGGSVCLGGSLRTFGRFGIPFSEYDLTPTQVRRIFDERCWSRVVGFHTRNPIHRGHEFIQREAMDRSGADGLFIHPVIGKKKSGDFSPAAIVRSYELMLDAHYRQGVAILSVFKNYSRYAGPREALFTAICRKNYGCSHFIVGRDHTGVGDFYPPYASHAIFERFPDLGIEPVLFEDVHSVSESRPNGDADEGAQLIAGSVAREYLRAGELPPEWLMRRDVAEFILEQGCSGEDIFV